MEAITVETTNYVLLVDLSSLKRTEPFPSSSGAWEMQTFLVELLIVPIKINFLSAKNILLPEQHSRRYSDLAAEYARRGSILGKNVFFFSVASSRPFREPYPTSCPLRTNFVSSGAKWPGCEAEVKNAWSCTSALPFVGMA